MWRTTCLEDVCEAVGRISIHVPRVEDDFFVLDFSRVSSTFQSTSPVWRTTEDCRDYSKGFSYFNPRPPCGGRRACWDAETALCRFQSTSPVWRTTVIVHVSKTNIFNFNPRPPCGGRHFALKYPIKITTISIHVPRVEDDLTSVSPLKRRVISIHVPRVEDDAKYLYSFSMSSVISIHVPRVEDDGHSVDAVARGLYFNPRPPCGGRLA